MSVNITINGESAGEALGELKTLAAGFMSTTAPATPAEPAATTTRRKTAAEKRQVSDGGERTGPEDKPETETQDNADEAGDKAKGEPEKLTHDSIRTALGAYVKKFGMAFAQEDGPKVITLALGARDPKDATVNWKISDIPDTQDALKKVLEGVVEMTTKNPFKREVAKA